MPWELDGNNPGANQFLGTRQDDPLRIKTRNNVNSAPAMIILPAPDANNTGNVGIGTPRPETLTGGRVLHIDNPNGPSALRLGAGATGQQWEWQSTVIGGVGAAMNLSKVTPPAFNPLTVLASGNVGIGTTTPNAKLEINNGDLLFRAAAEDPGDIIFQSAGGGQKGRIWSQPVPGAGLFLSSGDNNPRITIAQDGTVAFGTQAAGAPFPGELFLGGIRTSLRGFDGAGFHWIRSNGDEGDLWMAFVNANAVDPFVKRMVAAVDWYGPLFQEWSDVRTKTNIRQVGGPLDKLERIRGVAFEWAESPQALGVTPGRPSIGVIAQEVEAVFPELVSVYDTQGYKAVNYSGLTSVLIEAAKELKAETEALRSRIEALEQAA